MVPLVRDFQYTSIGLSHQALSSDIHPAPNQQSAHQFKKTPREMHYHDTAKGAGHGMSEVSEDDQTILVTSCQENTPQALGEMVLVTTVEGHK